LTQKYSFDGINDAMANELERRSVLCENIAKTSDISPVLKLLANSKFGCPTATCLLVKLGEASYDQRNSIVSFNERLQ
jgi:hypothetical protein